jgi:hypothetical protein
VFIVSKKITRIVGLVVNLGRPLGWLLGPDIF